MAEAATLALTRLMERFRLSPRERALAVALVAVMASVWAFAAFDRAQAARDASEAAQATSLSLQQAAESHGAAGFRNAVAEEARKVRAWSLAGPTLPIARVRAESELLGMARAAGVSEARIVPSPDTPAAEGPVQFLTVALEGDFDWLSFLTLLSLAAESAHSVAPRAIEVGEPEGEGEAARAARFRLSMQFVYAPQEAGA